jgi:hypothetical protein
MEIFMQSRPYIKTFAFLGVLIGAFVLGIGTPAQSARAEGLSAPSNRAAGAAVRDARERTRATLRKRAGTKPKHENAEHRKLDDCTEAAGPGMVDCAR